MPSLCADSGIPGERPHPTNGDSPRCDFHRVLREKWNDRNIKAGKRGSSVGYIYWDKYVRPRPERLQGTEVTAGTVTDIREAVAYVATVKAPIDSAIRYGRPQVEASDVRELLDAMDELLNALTPVIRRPD